MPYDPALVEQNNASRARLRTLAALDEALYQLPVGDGDWRIGTALAHIAFWDRRALYLIDRWEREGLVEQALAADKL